MTKDRTQLFDALQELEKRFPVYQWRIKGVDIWPLLKTRLFFDYYNRYLTTVKPESITSKIVRRIKKELNTRSLFISKNEFQNKPIGDKDIFFVAPSTVRINYDNKSRSRYFDTLMDSIQMSSCLLEYTNTNIEKCYKNERIINAASAYPFFIENVVVDEKEIAALENYIDFGEYVISSGLARNSDEIKKKLISDLREVLIWEKLWDNYLQQGNPKLSIIICYYSIPMFGYLLASKKRNIPCIDMQHGGQGTFHSMYNYSNIDESNYSNLLPDFFWVWDKNCANDLKNHVNEKRVLIGGNPWIQYLKLQPIKDTTTNKKIILYTLQDGISLHFPSKIVNAMKEHSDSFQWWIRMHPRMTKSEMANMYSEIKRNNLEKFLEIEKANEVPLPSILSQAEIHISYFSGCITEADIVGVPYNITISEIGKSAYSNLISSQRLFYFDIHGEQSFFSFIEDIQPTVQNADNQNYQYDKIIEDAINRYKN